MSGGTTRRPTHSASHPSGPRGALAAILAVAMLLGACATPVPLPSSGPATPASSGQPHTSTNPGDGASASPGITPLPTATPDPAWTGVDLLPVAPIATLEATRTVAAGVLTGSAFRITSLDGSDPMDLATHLTADPPLRLTATSADGAALVQPAAPMRAGAIYRFSLGSDDGTLRAAWAVQTVGPLAIVTSVPADGSGDVPLTTGLEVTFNQDGVALDDARAYISINPPVAGHLEQDGRTIAFVPERPLAPATYYQFIVRRGLPLTGTDQVLDEAPDITFQTTGKADVKIRVGVAHSLFQTGTADPAVLTVWLDRNLDETENEADFPFPKKVDVAVHRLATLEAAVAAWRSVSDDPLDDTPVDTSGLPRVLDAKVRLRSLGGGEDWQEWIRLPRTLRAGWYVVTVTVPGIASQAILEVTDVAVYALTTQSRSAIWVNDLRTKGALAGATVSILGQGMGRTGADGLLVARTPDRVVHPEVGEKSPVVVVRAGNRAAFVPVDGVDCEKCSAGEANPWWRLLELDRYAYRTNDTVAAWGVVRDRDTGSHPAAVTVRITAYNDESGTVVEIASMDAKPDSSGAFLVKLPLRDAPDGDYEATILVDGVSVSSQSFTVEPIVMPAWSIEASTTKHAILVGSSVGVHLKAAFFEGTPVAGVKLAMHADANRATVTAGAMGTADATLKIGHDREQEEPWQAWRVASVEISSGEPAEAQIGTSVPVAVFQSNVLARVAATATASLLTVKGSVHHVAWARFEAANPGQLDQVDPYGASQAGIRVRVHVVQHWTTTVRTGSEYDFISKQAVPVYRSTEHTKNLGTFTLHTDADGRFALRLPIASNTFGYDIEVDAFDADGRSATVGAWASVPERSTQQLSVWLEAAGTDPSTGESPSYSAGDPVRVDFQGGAGRTSASRYLWTMSLTGLAGTRITTAPRLDDTFRAAWVPGVHVNAVRFTGSGYEAASSSLRLPFRTEDRRLTLSLTTDKARYAPGDTATLSVRVADRSGAGVKATVYLRAIDEKLFASGMAGLADPMDALYEDPGSGVIGLGWTHFDPRPVGGGGGGDTTGGPGRSDFRDWLVNRLVTTGSDGRATTSFGISDDLTSWRIIGEAVSPSLQTGIANLSIPVSIPFFADVTLAPTYLTSDRPIVMVRAYGGGLAPTDAVTFTVTSDTLPMAAVTVASKAFEAVQVQLPALTNGTHNLRVEATTGNGATQQRDVLTRTFSVVSSRAVQATVTTAKLTGSTPVESGRGFTTLILSDAGRGRVVPILEELVNADTTRSDRALAAALAERILAGSFGIEGTSNLGETSLAAFQEQGGVAILPYAESDLTLAVLAAMTDDPRLGNLRGYFANYADPSDQELRTREERLWILAGQAAVGLPALDDLHTAAAVPDLTVSEQVIVALGAIAAGDDELARTIERAVLAKHGETYGPWVRITTRTSLGDALLTARLAIVAASLGDPLATGMDAFVVDNPPKGTAIDLERALAAAGWAKRIPAADATATLVVADGTQTAVRITASRPVTMLLTPAQADGARLEPGTGTVLVTTRTEQPLAATTLEPVPGLSITRRMMPGTTLATTDVVHVTITVTYDSQSSSGCWNVVELVP